MKRKINNLEIFGVIATALAIIGVVFNNFRCRECFVLWVVSNAITAVIHYRARIYSLLARDVIFLVLAVAGIVLQITNTRDWEIEPYEDRI